MTAGAAFDRRAGEVVALREKIADTEALLAALQSDMTAALLSLREDGWHLADLADLVGTSTSMVSRRVIAAGATRRIVRKNRS